MPELVYQTDFQKDAQWNASCYNMSGRSNNPFTRSDPCLKCVNNTSTQSNVTMSSNLIKVVFPPTTGSGTTFWTRIGTDYTKCTTFPETCTAIADCSTTQSCCPMVGNIRTGHFEFWIYVPPEDPTKINECRYNAQTQLPRTYPFYHGGKLLGVCSHQCPTGNGQTNPVYDQGWTLRLMFREQGRIAVLYSVPSTETSSFSLEPVPPDFQSCEPNGGWSSTSTDQYWFATTDSSLHAYRLAEYTFNPVEGLNCGQTQYVWPGGQTNPIDQILQYDRWNFLRVTFDVDEGTVQLYHGISEQKDTSSCPTMIPDLTIVVNTPKNTIPFTTKDSLQSVYWQPFYGGHSCDWLPSCLGTSCPTDETCYKTSDPINECSPFFLFGNLYVYSDTFITTTPTTPTTMLPTTTPLPSKSSSPTALYYTILALLIVVVVVVMGYFILKNGDIVGV